MNKALLSASLALLLLTSVLPSALAADNEAQAVTEDGKEATADKSLPSTFVNPQALAELDQLNLQTALSRAINSSFNLSLLQLKHTALITRQKDYKAQIQGLQYIPRDAYTLPVTPDDILENLKYQIPADAEPQQLFWMGPVLEMNTVVNGLMSGQVDSMNEMVIAQRVQLESAVKTLEQEKLESALELEEATQGTKLQVSGQYIQLLSQKKQADLLKEGCQVLGKELASQEILIKQGLITAESYRDLEVEFNNQGTELEQLQANYRLGLLQLSFDLGIRYNPNVLLEEIPLPEVKPVIRKSSEDILVHSYELKRLWNTLNQAQKDQKSTAAPNAYAREILVQTVQMIEEQIRQTTMQLNQSIIAAYAGGEDTYRQLVSAQREVDKVVSDFANANRRAEAGSIAQRDLNSVRFKVQQAETKAGLLRVQYFGILGKIEAMEKGLILPTQ